VLIPSVYGLGTALPVVLSAAVLAFAAGSFGRFFARITQVELWLRRITGAVFILVGVYYTLVYILHVLS
jgi:cytochrome c biogenesis protein CcdA